MNREALSTLVRAVLKFGGGFIVAKGTIDAEGLELAIGAIVTLVGVVWGAFDAKQATVAKKEVKHTNRTFGRPSQTNL